MSRTGELASPAAANTEPLGLRAVQAAYCAFLLSIPVETILYFQDDPSDPGSSVSLSRVLGVALFGLAAVQWRRCLRKTPPAFWLIVWYIAVYTLSQLWIPAELFARFHEQQVTLVQMAVLLLVSINLFADSAFRRRVLRLYGWWMALVAVAMLCGTFGVQFDAEGRDTILTQDPNLTACLFAAGALCLAGDPRLLDVKRRLWHVLLSVGAVAALSVAVLRTGSRGGLLALGAGFVALALGGGATKRRARAATVAVVLGLLGGLVRYEFDAGTTTAARLQRSWEAGDTAGRSEIYSAAWSMFLERPLLGYGGANNRFVLGANLNYPDRDTHNTFLAVLTEVGLVGGLAFLGALLCGLVSSWRTGRRTGDALPFALLCALLVANSSITGSREKILWIVLAAALSP